jgi:hypothetical protein
LCAAWDMAWVTVKTCGETGDYTSAPAMWPGR